MFHPVKEKRYEKQVNPAPWFARIHLKDFCGTIKGLSVCETYFVENKGAEELK